MVGVPSSFPSAAKLFGESTHPCTFVVSAIGVGYPTCLPSTTHLLPRSAEVKGWVPPPKAGFSKVFYSKIYCNKKKADVESAFKCYFFAILYSRPSSVTAYSAPSFPSPTSRKRWFSPASNRSSPITLLSFRTIRAMCLLLNPPINRLFYHSGMALEE